MVVGNAIVLGVGSAVLGYVLYWWHPVGCVHSALDMEPIRSTRKGNWIGSLLARGPALSESLQRATII